MDFGHNMALFFHNLMLDTRILNLGTVLKLTFGLISGWNACCSWNPISIQLVNDWELKSMAQLLNESYATKI